MATSVVPDFEFFKLKTFFILWCCVAQFCAALYDDDNPYRHREVFGGGRYVLDWMADIEHQRVIFNVTAQTNGYVGFGLSRSGKMSGADIVIGGVANGKSYFSDRHAIGNQLPLVDTQQDWTLHAAWETKTHTFLSFSRPFNTCDEDHDLPINDDVLGLIWAFGEKDNEIEYHHQNRGVFYAYLLDPDLTPRSVLPGQVQPNQNNLGNFKIWTITGNYEIPAQDTTYICTMHKSPKTNGRKQHIVGFNAILHGDRSVRHIHHYLLHRCHAPPGQSSNNVFQRFAGGERQECYILRQPGGPMPTQYCTEVYYVWEVSGKPFFLPDHVGLPLNENPDEYYMLQMHYDNPEVVSGLQVSYTLEIFYSDVRKHDAGVFTIGEATPASPSIMVPPGSVGHVTHGHCGSGCTSSLFPRNGIHVFAVNLHTHLAGRGVRLVHIRDNKELPWVLYDNFYNFNYQQIRLLREESTILPGDTLINRCVYGNTDRNGSVTIGGFSSRHEMCNGFIWYYNKIPNYSICRSEIRHDAYRRFFDIWNTTWSNERVENVVTSPPQNAGRLVSEVGNSLDWTLARRSQLIKYHRYLPQITTCPTYIISEENLPPQSYHRRPDTRSRYPSSGTSEFKPRRPSNDNDLSASSLEHEIIDPAAEFVSVYPANIVPYELPNLCRRK